MTVFLCVLLVFAIVYGHFQFYTPPKDIIPIIKHKYTYIDCIGNEKTYHIVMDFDSIGHYTIFGFLPTFRVYDECILDNCLYKVDGYEYFNMNVDDAKECYLAMYNRNRFLNKKLIDIDAEIQIEIVNRHHEIINALKIIN